MAATLLDTVACSLRIEKREPVSDEVVELDEDRIVVGTDNEIDVLKARIRLPSRKHAMALGGR